MRANSWTALNCWCVTYLWVTCALFTIRLAIGCSLEVAPQYSSPFRFQLWPLDRLFRYAPPAAACIRSRIRDVGLRDVRRKFDTDTASVAAGWIRQEHLFGWAKFGRFGIATAERMNAVTGLVAVSLARGGRGSHRLPAAARTSFLFRHQPFDL